jgi:hypothetical protein
MITWALVKTSAFHRTNAEAQLGLLLNECSGLLAAVEKCKRLFAMNSRRVQQGATRRFAHPYQAPEDRIFDFFLSDIFNAVMSMSPEIVPDTRSEQFRRTVQRRAGNYRCR